MFTDYMADRAVHLTELAYQAKKFSGAFSYAGDAWKYDWLLTGTSVLRALGKELGFSEMRVYKTKGGPGVTGESNLMGMWYHRDIGIYVTTNALGGLYYDMDSRSDGPYFMWRTIKHMKDYGGRSINQWEPYDSFENLDSLVELFNKVGVREVR